MKSATDTVVQFVHDHIEGRVIYCGLSLGGYLGMYIIGEHPGLFSAAIIADAGQDVGPTSSFAAKAGFVLMGAITSVMSRKSVISTLVNQMNKQYIPQELLDQCLLRCGTYFDCSEQQIQVFLYQSLTYVFVAFKGN